MVSKNIYRLPFDGEFALMPAPFHYESRWLRFALDFEMPAGTQIRASLEGKVIESVDKFEEGMPDRSFCRKANYIILIHKNGEYSQYAHLSKGNLVKKGDIVLAGDLIGFSGNSGFTTYSHLHFHVMKPHNDSYITIPTRFLMNERPKILFSPRE